MMDLQHASEDQSRPQEQGSFIAEDVMDVEAARGAEQYQPTASTSCQQANTMLKAASSEHHALAFPPSDLADSSPFSIRGYVAAVREVDITRCWPFSQKLLEDSIREGKDPLLPPLTPFGCAVKLQREYYADGPHARMEANASDVNDGPQLQVQIDLTKSEPDGQAASKPEEAPVTCGIPSQETQEPCKLQKELIHTHASLPFLDKVLACKRQAPRSIREIRKSVLQGCQCFNRMSNSACSKDACSKYENAFCSDTDRAALSVEDTTAPDANDKIAGAKKRNFASMETASVITELDCGKKDSVGKKACVGMQISGVDATPNFTVSRSHRGVKGTDGQLNIATSYDIRKSMAVAEKTIPTSEPGKELLPHMNLESNTQMECTLDSQSIGVKSVESQNSKSLNSGPCSDFMMQTDAFDIEPSSENIPQQRCPVCLLFQCSSNTALNAHIDRCLIASSSEVMLEKSKAKLHRGKARKKRSMAELCQVAPPCGGVVRRPTNRVLSQPLKESCTPTRKRIKLQTTASMANVKLAAGQARKENLIKSQAQALQFLQWRSRSASSRRELQLSHGATRRSALHDARLTTFNKLKFRSRRAEQTANSMLRTKHWKRHKSNHETPLNIASRVPNVADHKALQLKKLIRPDKTKHVEGLQEDGGQSINTANPQKNNLQGSREAQSKSLQKSKPAASNPKLLQKWKASKQAHVQTSDAVVTIEGGSHKTTVEFLRPPDQNKEVDPGNNVQVRVHVKAGKRKKKQSITADKHDAIIHFPSIPLSAQNGECVASISNKDPTDRCNQQTLDLGGVGMSFKPVASSQSHLAEDQNGSPSNLRRLAEECLLPEPCFSLLSSMMQGPQHEVRIPPVTRKAQMISTGDGSTSLLHSSIPSTDKSGRPETQGTKRCTIDIDNVPLLLPTPQPKGIRNPYGECVPQAWHSLLKETRQVHVADSQQTQASIILSGAPPHQRHPPKQRYREFPFSLDADEFSPWHRESESANGSFIMPNSERGASCRPPRQVTRPVQASEFARMVGAGSLRPHTHTTEAGICFSIHPQTSQATHQLNHGSLIHSNQLITPNAGSQRGLQVETWQAPSPPQTLPAWMQAALQERRSSAMLSCVELPTNCVSQSTMLNATPCSQREVAGPSPSLDMIGNPVLRLMGKTMVLMPESHQNQVELTTTHFNNLPNYINFFPSLNSGDMVHKQQLNTSRAQNSDTHEGRLCQDNRSNKGIRSWIGSEACSTPQIQDFFLQIPAASQPNRNSPLANPQAGLHHTGGNMLAQNTNSQWLHHRSSPLPPGMLQTTQTNLQHQKVPSTAFFQPHSSLFCQHNQTVPGPSFLGREISSSLKSSCKCKNATSHRTMKPMQNSSNLTQNYPTTVKASPLPCWLSSSNRADQHATVIVLDDEGPLCSFDAPARGAFGEVVLASRAADQTQQDPWPQTRPKITGPPHPTRETEKSKMFIPIIYTVGSNFKDSHCTSMAPTRFTGDYECNGADQGSGAPRNSRRKSSSFIEQRGRTRISNTDGGGSPADIIKLGANSRCSAGASDVVCALTHTATVESLRAVSESAKGLPNKGTQMWPSRKCPDWVQQGNSRKELSTPRESGTSGMGMCSVNMNPAEVDCQDAGQFMSTPTLVSSFRAMPECAGSSTVSLSQAPGSNPSQTSFTTAKARSAALRPAIGPDPSGPTPQASLRNERSSAALGLSCKQATGTEKSIGSMIFDFSKRPSSRGDLAMASTIRVPSRMDDPGIDCRPDKAEGFSSRMQALKIGRKFRIINGRVSMMQKEVHEGSTSMQANAALNGGDVHIEHHVDINSINNMGRGMQGAANADG